jgi:hypothetical protein
MDDPVRLKAARSNDNHWTTCPAPRAGFLFWECYAKETLPQPGAISEEAGADAVHEDGGVLRV